MPDFFKKMKKKVDKNKMTGGEKLGSKEKAPRRLKFLPLSASTTSIFCRRKREDSAESHGENPFDVYLNLEEILFVFTGLYAFNFMFFYYWRGEAQEASQQEEKTAAAQGSTDQEAEDQTACQGEDATGQSCHHRSVRTLVFTSQMSWKILFICLFVFCEILDICCFFLQLPSHLFTYKAVFLRHYPPRLQPCVRRLRPDVSHRCSQLHRHHIWILGFWGKSLFLSFHMKYTLICIDT